MNSKETFSRWGIIFAGIGMAVGTGNLWRFPRIAAQFGGGVFMIIWILFLLFLPMQASIQEKHGYRFWIPLNHSLPEEPRVLPAL